MTVTEVVERLDLPFLAGINSVLGFDDDGKTLRVVLLKKHANIVHQHVPKYSVQQYFSHTFASSPSQTERIECVKNLLHEHAITSKYVVSSIQTAGVKIVEVPLPQEVEDVDAWIEEHYERLIRLPIPFKEIRYSYEVRQQTVEIAFVRKSDIDEHMAFFYELGLEVIGLGVGVFDAVNVTAVTDALHMNGEYMQYHISKNQIHVFQFEAGNIEKHTIIPISDSSEVSSVISNISANQSVVVSGDVSADNIPSNAQLLSPLALTPEYNLAVGLVLKGLGCTITTFDVLDATLQEKHEIGIYKSLVQRTVLFAGAFLLFLLLLPVAADMLFQNKIDALEEQRLSDPLYAQVAALESQVKTLERQHAERLGVQQRAHISRLMYTIGKIMPEKVWLYKLSIGKSKKSMTLSLHGYSNDPEQIMEFLKRLEREHCSPSLVRSGSELPAETAMIPAGGSFTTFEIKAIAEE